MTAKRKTVGLLYCALFAALTGICAVISIPLAPVPISLATLASILSGGLLGPKYGAASQAVYIALGAVGVPIFAGFTSGVGILVGPTGGYLLGYVAMAFLIGFILNKYPQNGSPMRSTVVTAAAILAGTAACYTLGTLWFLYVTGSSLVPALMMCVIPFLPGDALKLIAGTILIRKLRPHIERF